MATKRDEYRSKLEQVEFLCKKLRDELTAARFSLQAFPDAIGANSIQAAKYAADLKVLTAELRDLGIELTPIPSFAAEQSA